MSGVDWQALRDEARAMTRRAYAPYSGVFVGACALVDDGRLVRGCNVENASYGLTICAERNAIFHAVAEEGPGMRIATLAVVCTGHEFPPCGACRQVIAEFATVDTAVWFLKNGEFVATTISELLPGTFSLSATGGPQAE